MNKLLNTIGCAVNSVGYKEEVLEIADRDMLEFISSPFIYDYQDDDKLLDTADKYFRFIVDCMLRNNIEKYKNEDGLYYVLIDINSCLVKYFIDILNLYQDTELEDMIDAGEDKDIANILKSLIVYLPVYNVDKTAARAIVCINSI